MALANENPVFAKFHAWFEDLLQIKTTFAYCQLFVKMRHCEGFQQLSDMLGDRRTLGKLH